MTDQTEVRLPPLPEFFGYIGTNDLDPDAGEEGYLAYQMQDYARLAVMEERERCARIADDEARIREEAGQKHPEDSEARGRCFAAARAAQNVAKGVRGGEVVCP